MSLLPLVLAFAAAAPPSPAAGADEGRPVVIGRSYLVPSRELGGERRVNVYRPAACAPPAPTCTTVFLLDGGEAEDFHHVTGLAQVVAFSGRTEPLVVVGIKGVDRRHDLTSPSSDAEDRRVAPTSGGAAAYRRFLVEELKPWVRARFGLGRTALMGESLAGLFVLETALRAPASFDDYLAVSPSLWWDGQALSRGAAADLARGGLAGHRLYLATADEGGAMQAAADRVVVALTAAGARGPAWRHDPMPAERHDSVYHPAALAAFRWLYAKPAPPR